MLIDVLQVKSFLEMFTEEMVNSKPELRNEPMFRACVAPEPLKYPGMKDMGIS